MAGQFPKPLGIKKMALKAWLWVDAETLRSVASMVRKTSTPCAPMLHLPIPPMPTIEKLDPILISLFGAKAIVQITNALAHLIHQASGLQRGRAGFHG